MAKHKIFDWYTFLTKKVLKYEVFNSKNVSLSFWADGAVDQGNHFHVYTLCANSWDCPVTVDIKMKVTPKTFISTKKKANRLIVPRQWNISLGPGEIVLASASGYACFDCKPCTITFAKAKVSKEGKGKRVLKRRGKPLGVSVNPLGLLLLPLGFIVFSWRCGTSLELPVKKDKTKTEDKPEDLQQQNLLLQPIWSLAEANKVDISPLTAAFGQEEAAQFEAEIESLCRQAYSKWCRKHGQNPDLEIVRSAALTSDIGVSEQADTVSAVPINVNW